MVTSSVQHDSMAPRTAPEPSRRDQHTRELFLLARACESPEERQELIDTVIEMHLKVAYREAAHYGSRGILLEDLRQVAALALTRAAHRFDVTTGHDFLSYAMPCVRGEIRKHFRDCGWTVRPPRRIQELQGMVTSASAELHQRLGRSPRPSEVAEHLGQPLPSVIEALASHGCFSPASLDSLAGTCGSDICDVFAAEDHSHQAAEARVMLQPALATLSERDVGLLKLRFGEGLTQREIGERIGSSQMHVSRRLSQILRRLRQALGEIDGRSASI